MWPFGLSHVKQGTGTRSGWSRQQNVEVLPVADKMAGVDMRLAPGAYRELHWHTSVRCSCLPKFFWSTVLTRVFRTVYRPSGR